MDARLFGLNRIMLSMSNLSEYGELLNALFRLVLIAEDLGLPSLDDAETENTRRWCPCADDKFSTPIVRSSFRQYYSIELIV